MRHQGFRNNSLVAFGMYFDRDVIVAVKIVASTRHRNWYLLSQKLLWKSLENSLSTNIYTKKYRCCTKGHHNSVKDKFRKRLGDGG